MDQNQESQPTQSGNTGAGAESRATEQPTRDTSAAAPVRPEGLPDSYWDAEKGVKLDDLLRDHNTLVAADAARASAAARVPAKPDDYKLEFPQDFKAPDGVKFDFENHPAVPVIRELAHKAGWTQDDLSKNLAIYAQVQGAEIQHLSQAAAAEREKLGANGPARLDALQRFYKARYGDDGLRAIAPALVTAASVGFFEKLMDDITKGGMPAVNGRGRETEPAGPNLAGLKGAEKIHAIRMAAQAAKH